MIDGDWNSAAQAPPDSEEWAAQAFARRRFGAWTAADESGLEARIEQDPACAGAFRRVEQSWAAVGQHATSAELMRLREKAISRARRAAARRWMKPVSAGQGPALRIAAGIAALGIAVLAAYQLTPFGVLPGEYRTTIAEQRSIELPDHTRVALDADTRLRVRFSKDGRTVQLLKGQAEFGVAKDPARPFKVVAGNNTVVAVGTVFTVEYLDREMRVAMLEGKVAVFTPRDRASGTRSNETDQGKKPSLQQAAPISMAQRGHNISPGTPVKRGAIELVAGEALYVRRDGQTDVIAKADLDAATAWRDGKVIFRSEPLGVAVRRLNRYSRVQLELADSALAAMNISGLFDAGDTAAFVEAVQSYLPVTADYSDGGVVRLNLR